MRLRNGSHGYGALTKLLHWLTVVAIAGQFVLGLTLEGDGDGDAAADRAQDRVDAFEDRGKERAESRGAAAEERFSAEVQRRKDAADALDRSPSGADLRRVLTGVAYRDGLSMLEAHLTLGLAVLALGLVRLLWRRTTPLPPWAEHLSAAERTLESRLEKGLLALLLVVPVTGVLLVLGEDDLLVLHVAAQLALLATVAVHVGLVLKHTVGERNRHLARML